MISPSLSRHHNRSCPTTALAGFDNIISILIWWPCWTVKNAVSRISSDSAMRQAWNLRSFGTLAIRGLWSTVFPSERGGIWFYNELPTVLAMCYHQKRNLGTSDLFLGGVLCTLFELSMIHTAVSRAEYGKYVWIQHLHSPWWPPKAPNPLNKRLQNQTDRSKDQLVVSNISCSRICNIARHVNIEYITRSNLKGKGQHWETRNCREILRCEQVHIPVLWWVINWRQP